MPEQNTREPKPHCRSEEAFSLLSAYSVVKSFASFLSAPTCVRLLLEE